MQDLPHHYRVSLNAEPSGTVALTTNDAPLLVTAAAAEFGGPGDQWSPETLLVAASVDGFTLSFKAISAASSLQWSGLDCTAEGVLDRVAGVTRMTRITISATLTVPEGTDTVKAEILLEKAQASCMISHSLRCEVNLQTDVIIDT